METLIMLTTGTACCTVDVTYTWLRMWHLNDRATVAFLSQENNDTSINQLHFAKRMIITIGSALVKQEL